MQVQSDYLKKNFESALELDTAVALCCLEIRRMFKDMPSTALDKKANFECLERDVGLAKFFPNVRNVIQIEFDLYAVKRENYSLVKLIIRPRLSIKCHL